MTAHHSTRVARAATPQRPSLVHVWPFRLGGAYVVLALVLLASALAMVMFAVFPPTAETPRIFDADVAAFCVVLAALVLFVAPRTKDGWGLDACLAASVTLAAAVASWMPRAEGQLLVGFGLVLAGAYTAYYRPRGRMAAHIVWMLVIYGVALLLAPRLSSWLYFGVVAGTVTGLALLVSILTSRLRELAFRDPLTGLLNRRGFDMSIEQLMALSARSGRPLTLGLIDLDGFKSYNDAYGHFAGDDLLIEVSTAWRAALRGADLLARFGGDEFVLVLPGSTPQDARELETRLRRTHATGWSIGFAPWHPGMSAHDALTNADAELYAEKRTRGRRAASAPHPETLDLSSLDAPQHRMLTTDNR